MDLAEPKQARKQAGHQVHHPLQRMEVEIPVAMEVQVVENAVDCLLGCEFNLNKHEYICLIKIVAGLTSELAHPYQIRLQTQKMDCQIHPESLAKGEM